MLDAAGMQQETGLGRPPDLGGPDNHRGRHARNPAGVLRRIAGDRRFDVLPAGGVSGDERAIDPSALDHHVQHAVEHADVTARPHRNEQIGGPGDRRHPWIEHDQAGAVLARLPQVIGRDRCAFGDVRARDEDGLGSRDVAPRVGAPVDAEDLLGRRGRRDHAEAAVVVDVRRAQRHTGEFAHQIRLFVGERGAGEHGEGVAAVGRLNALNLARRPIERRVPADRPEAVLIRALERGTQTIRVLVLHVPLHALRAQLASVEREFFPWLEADNPFVLDLELDAALLAAETAMRLHDAVGLAARLPSAGRLPIEVRAEAIDERSNRGRQFRHHAPRFQSRSCVTARFFRRQDGQTS